MNRILRLIFLIFVRMMYKKGIHRHFPSCTATWMVSLCERKPVQKKEKNIDEKTKVCAYFRTASERYQVNAFVSCNTLAK